MRAIGQTKGEATRQALMNAGFRVFAAKGYLRAQIGDIVREAGKSNGVFHIYFRNKDALLDAWLDECDRTVPWYYADTELLFEKRRRFILESFWALYERFGPILDALDAAAYASQHFEQRRGDIQTKGNDSIARMIRHAQQEGRYLGIDPALTAISITAAIAQTTAYWFHHRDVLAARGVDRQAMIRHLETIYARILEPAVDIAASDETGPSPARLPKSHGFLNVDPARGLGTKSA